MTVDAAELISASRTAPFGAFEARVTVDHILAVIAASERYVAMVGFLRVMSVLAEGILAAPGELAIGIGRR